MASNSLSNKKSSFPYWTVLSILVPIACIGTFIYNGLYWAGTFRSWRSLGSPPSGVSSIINADVSVIWVETNDNKIYKREEYCTEDGVCDQWLQVEDRSEIEPFFDFPVLRGSNCDSLGDYNPGNPPNGNMRECVLLVASGYPDPQWGTHKYYALMSDGQIMFWSHGSGTLSIFATFAESILVSIFVAILISIIYLVIFVVRKIKRRLTMRAADLGYAPRFLVFFLASSWFRQNGVLSSHPKRLTRAVRRLESPDRLGRNS